MLIFLLFRRFHLFYLLWNRLTLYLCQWPKRPKADDLNLEKKFWRLKNKLVSFFLENLLESSDWPHTCCSRELLHAVRFCFSQSQRWFVTEAGTCSFHCSSHDCSHVDVTQEQLLIKTTSLSLTLSLSVKCATELPGKIPALLKSIR